MHSIGKSLCLASWFVLGNDVTNTDKFSSFESDHEETEGQLSSIEEVTVHQGTRKRTHEGFESMNGVDKDKVWIVNYQIMFHLKLNICNDN